MRFMRHLLLCLAVLLCGATVSAQTHYKAHVSVGVHGGWDMNKVTFNPSIDQSWKNGMAAGVHVVYQEEKIVGLQAELNFVQRGWEENIRDTGLRYGRRLNYITLPVMTHIAFGSKRVKCIVNLGPEIGFLIGESIKSDFDYHNPGGAGVPPTWQTYQFDGKITGHFDYGITAGVGCEFYVRPRHSITLEARYYFGLGNVFPSSKADVFSASRAMTLCATLGYSFRVR